MALTTRKRWNAKFTLRIDSYPELTFYGRKPFAVADVAYVQALLDLGTFRLRDDGQLSYCGNASWKGRSGKIYEVDADGLAALDFSDIDAPRAALEAELEDPE